ncbi:MAG: DNA ligase (NAD(+)) LigA [Rhodospirillaceae bacterium]|nr:DNA ligase (NAD(+)) LigA [Rhodospirillaceae bacterium]
MKKNTVSREVQLLSKKEAIQELQKLFLEIRKHDNLYYNNDSPEITDAEYDKLKLLNLAIEERFPELIKTKSPSKTVGGEPAVKFSRVRHTVPMLSLANIFNNDDIEKFLSRIRQELRLDFTSELEISVEPKIDGVSFSALYENGRLVLGSTRGNGSEGENITQNLKTIAGLPKILTSDLHPVPKILEIRGEVFINKNDFLKLNQEQKSKGSKLFANPRNAAAGSLRQIDPLITQSRNLRVFAYAWGTVENRTWDTQHSYLTCLKDWGVPVNPDTEICLTADRIKSVFRSISDMRGTLDYDIDGVVYKVNSVAYQMQIGALSKAPKWAVAHKFEAERASTVLKKIDIQVGRTGALTPVGRLQPINVGGVIVSNVTLHNESEIKRKDIREGDTVIIQRAGDVIPQIIKVVQEKRRQDTEPFSYPEQCPECQSTAICEEDEVVRRCTGGLACPAQAVERLKHFVSRNAFDIEGLGKNTIDDFYAQNRIKNPADIFTLELRDSLPHNLKPIRSNEGWGRTSAAKLFKAINERRTISLDRFLFALGIRHVGQETTKLLARKYKSIDMLQDQIAAATATATGKNSEEYLTLCNIKGIGEKIASGITSFFSSDQNQKIIMELQKQINIEPLTEVVNTNSFLTNKTVVFTGTLEKMSRTTAKNEAELKGARVSNSVSAKTDIVVAGQNAGSKARKATLLGIQIVSEDDYIQLINT